MTIEGAAVWDLVQRMVGQLRFTAGGHVAGLEMGTAFTLAAALGVNTFALAELFPPAEAAVVRKLNEQIGRGGRDTMIRGDADHG